MFNKIKIFCLFQVIFFSSIVNSTEIDVKNLSSISFNSLPVDEKSLSEEEYVDFIRNHIFSQPEYAFALAGESEKKIFVN